MKKVTKKLITCIAVLTMVFSTTILAFADSNDVTAPVGDGEMYLHLDVSSDIAHASMDLSECGDMSIDGRALQPENHEWKYMYGGADQAYSYGTHCYADDYFNYAEATFSGGLNSGGSNRVYVNCSR